MNGSHPVPVVFIPRFFAVPPVPVLPICACVPCPDEGAIHLEVMMKVEVRGVLFDNLTLSETVALIRARLDRGEKTAVYTPNSEIVQACIENPDLYGVINSGEVICPDGIGVIMAAKVLGTPLKEKVAGIEVGESLIASLTDGKAGVFLLGGKPGVAEAAAEKLSAKYPGLSIVGTNDGYFQKEGPETDAVVEKINQSGAEVLFVCLGAPAQEKWIAENRKRLAPTVMLGLGGSLDAYAGTVKRAPRLFIRLGLEWFYRLLCEPWRIKRMMKLPKFYFGTVWHHWTHR